MEHLRMSTLDESKEQLVRLCTCGWRSTFKYPDTFCSVGETKESKLAFEMHLKNPSLSPEEIESRIVGI